jgi:pyruvate formate lyase activating enzyme
MPQDSGLIFDVDHFAVHDGPGIRAVVYFKGCPLRCAWCHSPESQLGEPQAMRIPSKCLSCAVCAAEACPNGAYRLCGRYMTVPELMSELLPDKVFYDSSGGGVTLSGGEVLFQPDFAAALLAALRAEGIHTIIESSMLGGEGAIRALSPLADVFYCDVKCMDPIRHKEYTGADNSAILANIGLLAGLRGGSGIVLRVPLIPGYNDAPGDVAAVYGFALELGLCDIHLLPYNTSAPAKYEWLGLAFPPGELERQSAPYLAELVSMAPTGLNVTVQ